MHLRPCMLQEICIAMATAALQGIPGGVSIPTHPSREIHGGGMRSPWAAAVTVSSDEASCQGSEQAVMQAACHSGGGGGGMLLSPLSSFVGGALQRALHMMQVMDLGGERNSSQGWWN